MENCRVTTTWAAGKLLGTSSRIPGAIPTLPTLFLQTCSEVGEETNEFSPRRQINLAKEARHSVFLFYLFWVSWTIYTMYMYANLLNIWAICWSAEQSTQGASEKAMN